MPKGGTSLSRRSGLCTSWSTRSNAKPLTVALHPFVGQLSSTHPRTVRTPLALLHGFGRRLVSAFWGLVEVLLLGRIFLCLALSRSLLLSPLSLVALLVSHTQSSAISIPYVTGLLATAVWWADEPVRAIRFDLSFIDRDTDNDPPR